MAGAIQLTEVDFEQIKTNLIDYLRSTRQFTDYDFAGSNLQVILDLISYQAQLNAYSTNMIANESFLASATIRQNVVANARAVGYVPASARSARCQLDFQFVLRAQDYPSGFPRFIELQPGIVFSTGTGVETFTFNAIEPLAAPVSSEGIASFINVTLYEGVYLTQSFTNNDSIFDQKFILDNQNIDISTLKVEVQEDPEKEYNTFYSQANNMVKVNELSAVYWVEEVNEEYYELTFGDGLFGRKLKDGAIINTSYCISNGSKANDINANLKFNYSGRAISSFGTVVKGSASVTTSSPSFGGAEIESVSSIKFRAPRAYSSQNRAVIASDYATLVREIYPAVAGIYVYGGEELDIPEYGRVFIVIKPTTGVALSNTTKRYIAKSLNDFRIASLEIVLQDPEILYLEINTVVYYNDKNTLKDNANIASEVKRALSSYFIEGTIDKFGGAARYSRIVGAIDDADPSITRNTTELIMRKDFQIVPVTPASYEICFEQALEVNTAVSVVQSTGFQLLINNKNDSREYFFKDDTFGNIYAYYLDDNNAEVITDPNFGTVDYENGEVKLGYVTPITFANTTQPNSIIQIRAKPFGQDVVAKKTVYLDLDVDSSTIDAIIDENILSQ